MSDTLPDYSIVIPVYNEAKIVRVAALELTQKLDALSWNYELLLAENGSKDQTREAGGHAAKRPTTNRSSPAMTAPSNSNWTSTNTLTVFRQVRARGSVTPRWRAN